MKIYILYLILFNIIIESCSVLGEVPEECKIYNSLKNLPSDTDCCQLQCKVNANINVCNEQGQVQCLALENQHLISIPEEVYSLINLTNLYLKDNNINTLPDSFANLVNLRHLNLYGNKFSEFPEIIIKLPILQVLDIKSNFIKEIPPSIGNLKTLTYLGIGSNLLTTLPKEIGNLIKVTTLNAAICNIKTLPNEIGNMKSLKNLWVGVNKLESLPSTIGNLKSLNDLSILDNNNLKNIPPEIFKLPNLKKLDLTGCNSLNINIINFVSPLDECYFANTNISCYQPGSCKKININIDNKKDYIDEDKFLSKSRTCSAEEINSVMQNINTDSDSNFDSVSDSDSNYNRYIYIIVSVGGVIILALLGYIYYLKRRTNTKNTNVYVKNSSDVAIDSKHRSSHLPSESESFNAIPDTYVTITHDSVIAPVIPSTYISPVSFTHQNSEETIESYITPSPPENITPINDKKKRDEKSSEKKLDDKEIDFLNKLLD